jgi:hypothetical protein
LLIAVIATSTLVNNLFNGFEIEGWLRIVKLFIYVCIPVVLAKWRCDFLVLKVILIIGLAAMALNLYILLLVGASIVGGDLAFDIDIISGGLSGKYINIQTGGLESTGKLSHGVWSTYVAFLLAAAGSLKSEQKIGVGLFVVSLVLVIINTASSISREGFLLIICIFFVFGLRQIQAKRHSRGLKIIASIIAFAIIMALVVVYGSESQMGQKLMFMFDALGSGELDGNLQGRINTWVLTLHVVSQSVVGLVLGVGYSPLQYANELDKFSQYADGGIYSHVAESMFFMILAFGGIAGLLILIAMCFSLYRLYVNAKIPGVDKGFFGAFFIGLLFTNIFSGSTALSDLVMLHLLLFIGVLYGARKRKRQTGRPFDLNSLSTPMSHG